MKSFRSKVAAITGAGSGMGRTLALALARRGCHVALSDVDASGLAQTRELVEALGGATPVSVTSRRLDVSDRADMTRWAAEVVRDHARCNLIFNNAGISHGSTVEGTEYDDFERVMNENFWGVVHGTKAYLPHLRASGEGHVVNTSSVFGLIAVPGQNTYNASKFAVRGFTEALRIELDLMGAPVSATSVHPGGIKTNIARASKIHGSLKDLGFADTGTVAGHFEKAFRVTAEEAAETILRGVERNAPRVLVGKDAHVIDLMQRLVPERYQSIVVRAARRAIR
jgi:NAD(P)-dependent dehydrogenase (short-subunit alcohol dehydrogenase family)